MNRIAIARETLKILDTGYYHLPNGQRVDIDRALNSCLAQTEDYDPDRLSAIAQKFSSRPRQFAKTEFEVRNETTLTGAERMARSRRFQKIGVLNFASAKNPGGGFLKGAQAQEESLARSSALYKSLLKCPQYYEYHRSQRSLLYSNRIIYSPGCPVFRRDDGTLLEQPYFVDFITSPAPNAGAIWRHRSQEGDRIREVLYDRGFKLLSLAGDRGCDALVLGAWGCGVFKNDPSMVAQMFADFLLPDSQFWGKFKSVIFSVLDSTKQQTIFPQFKHQLQIN